MELLEIDIRYILEAYKILLIDEVNFSCVAAEMVENPLAAFRILLS